MVDRRSSKRVEGRSKPKLKLSNSRCAAWCVVKTFTEAKFSSLL